jgi:hypothetical protein
MPSRLACGTLKVQDVPEITYQQFFRITSFVDWTSSHNIFFLCMIGRYLEFLLLGTSYRSTDHSYHLQSKYKNWTFFGSQKNWEMVFVLITWMVAQCYPVSFYEHIKRGISMKQLLYIWTIWRSEEFYKWKQLQKGLLRSIFPTTEKRLNFCILIKEDSFNQGKSIVKLYEKTFGRLFLGHSVGNLLGASPWEYKKKTRRRIIFSSILKGKKWTDEEDEVAW